MKIPLITQNNNYNNFSLNFEAMKKSQFDGVDLLVVEKFKAPIEKFNNKSDFYKWIEQGFKQILNRNFDSKTPVVKEKRDVILDIWKKFFQNSTNYPISEKLLILDGVTKGVTPLNDNLPLVLNEKILIDLMKKLRNDLSTRKNLQFNFQKTYRTKLRSFYTQMSQNNKLNGWIIVPSKANDEKNFAQNVEKLQILSHKSWCTKSYMTEAYLTGGDIHIFFKNNEPKLAIRFFKNTIVEIQGENNNGIIPANFKNMLKSYIKENNYNIIERIKKDITL